MTDLADAPLSTTIDTDSGPSAAGGGQVVEPASLRDDIEAAFKEDAEAEKPVEKPVEKAPEKEAEKPEAEKAENPDKGDKAEQGEKPAEAEEAAKPGKEEQAKEERRFAEAPPSFLPKAKEVWRNTPHAVQDEVARLVQEHNAATEQSRATVERYEQLRQFDDLARSNGRDLRESLARITEIEDKLQSNPLAGLNEILREIGPRKADGQPYSLYEVAQFVAQQEPQNYQRMVAQPPQQPREDPRVAELTQEVSRLREEHLASTIVEPFKRDNPRFEELSKDIAFFLESDRIPASLSPRDRLAAAYDMAERINPPSHVDQPSASDGLADTRRADVDFSGSKSIKSSPGSITETYEPQAKVGESIGDSLRKEMRRLNRA